MTDYSEYNLHLTLCNETDPDIILEGFALRSNKVAQGIDSKTILDRMGANQLIGRGDMLFLQGNEPIRVQCAFVDTPEVVEVPAKPQLRLK